MKAGNIICQETKSGRHKLVDFLIAFVASGKKVEWVQFKRYEYVSAQSVYNALRVTAERNSLPVHVFMHGLSVFIINEHIH